jgi:enediyne biosynthesis protein E4
MWRFVLIIFVVSSCTFPENKKAEDKSKLFTRLAPEETGINFQNALEVREDFDVFRYRNFYNGGGVAIADINNDGLSDVYLTSNMGDNKLYLNKGSWKFEDITEKAGVKGNKYWSTGVSIADVNSDGLLDIYVSNAGDIKGDNRENELFINNGNLTFTDKAGEYGLNDKGFSTHATFFDFDKDGDLDCYVLNNSYRPVASLGYRNLRNVRDEFGGHKLYRNDNGKFRDISEQAGIFGSVIGFGLGVTVGDVNQDNWPDLYISNDFYERDYLYINNHDGTFREELERYMGHISMFSMGADLADLTNDGYPEIFSTDMLPKDDYRLKTISAFEPYDVYQLRLKNGYYHQFMRNMLHLNNQDGTFSEVGQMAGVDATDWSWGALIADFNNDLNKEIFVCNGIYKDVTTQDFVEFLGSSEQMRAAIEGKKTDFRDFVDRMPSVKLSNHMFSRTGALKFEDVSPAWGLNEPSFSNGAAYGDLDNDGDLDLIVNNVNQDVFVYKNQSRELENNNYLAVTFRGYKKNQFGLGANVKVYVDGLIVAIDNMPIRGFQSSMDYKMIFGLAKNTTIDSLKVTWPDDKVQIVSSVKVNQTITLDYANASPVQVRKPTEVRPFMKEISMGVVSHTENSFNDFDRDRLLYHMLSTQGPGIAVADLNNDGLDDFYLGGSAGNAGKLYIQRSDRFDEIASDAFNQKLGADEVDAAFFDMDNDGDQDLYVVTGGSENLAQSAPLIDKLYENTGMRNGVPIFKLTEGRIPVLYQSGSCVRPADVDNDGDVDLFVGTRGIPSYYGLPADQFLLINDGSANFKEASANQAPAFRKLGIVTDARWFDYDKNGFEDIVIVGEWMPITIFANDGKQLRRVENIKGLENSQGLWNTIQLSDLDEDGDMDFIAGNLGLNSKLQGSIESPLILHVNDFDQNGSLEPVFTYTKDGKEYPMALRQDIIKQMSSLKKKFVYYKDYADKSIADIFDQKLIANGETLKVVESRTSVIINEGPTTFRLEALPVEAQVAPVYGIAIRDINGDKHQDIILGGNLFSVKPEIGRYDALHGLVVAGDGKGNFSSMSSQQSGLMIEGEIRHIVPVRRKGHEILSLIRNNDTIKFYSVNK